MTLRSVPDVLFMVLIIKFSQFIFNNEIVDKLDAIYFIFTKNTWVDRKVTYNNFFKKKFNR